MYSVVFEGDNGAKFLFGPDGNNVFDMDLGNGLSVSVGTSQGFSQVGETVESMSVGSRPIKVNGVIFKNIYEGKTRMRKIFAPFTWGRLIFNGTYYTRVCVKDSPTFSSVKDDGRFTMQFLAPFPYFYLISESNLLVGGIEPRFKFPVNYAEPHLFGVRSSNKFSNIYNEGDVEVPLQLHIQSFGDSVNPRITNLSTQEQLQLNGTLTIGETINIYRDKNNVLRAELTTYEGTVDILSWIDDSSDLFLLHVGDNLIGYDDDNGGMSLMVRFTYSPAVVAVYES